MKSTFLPDRPSLAALAFAIANAGCHSSAPTVSRSTEIASAATAPIVVTGLAQPESALHDPVADVYLVSNLSGSPMAVDHDGFISRIAPDGRVLALRFIDSNGAADGLSAPKGMALVGRTLYVTDIDRVRTYDADTGAARATITIPGATFLNDADAAPDGTVYVTDSGNLGAKLDLPPSEADAVFAIHGGDTRRIAHGAELGHPNGILVHGDKLEIVTLGTGEWLTLDRSGALLAKTKLPGGMLDGVLAIEGSILVSSWTTASLYRIDKDSSIRTVATELKSPADIGYDAKRGKVLVPQMMLDRLLVMSVAAPTAL